MAFTEYKREGFVTRTESIAVPFGPATIIRGADFRRLAIAISPNFAASPASIGFSIGGRTNGITVLPLLSSLSTMPIYVYRRSELGDVICGDVVAFPGVVGWHVYLTEYIDAKLSVAER